MASQTSKNGIWFVYRSHYEGPLSKRIRRIEAPSVVDWFREKLTEARRAETPRDIANADLGGYVYGFGTVFEAVKEHDLRPPRTTEALEKILREHLYVEGGEENVLIDDHSLRVRTDDDEVELAYFFFDDEVARQHPERVAWLLHDEPRLPDGGALRVYEPPLELEQLLPAGTGEGCTYAVFLTHYDGATLPGQAFAIPGVRLPELPAHLCRVIPEDRPASYSPEYRELWPIELRLIRAFLVAERPDLERALERCAAYPMNAVVSSGSTRLLGVGPHKDAKEEFIRAARNRSHDGDPQRSTVQVGRHVAMLCAHTSQHFGYQQWIFFDDRWAAAHVELASSLLWYASRWDPFAEPEAKPRVSKVEIEAEEADVRAYRPAERFAKGDRVRHPKFGLGLVQEAEATKIIVVFADGMRTLAHGMKI